MLYLNLTLLNPILEFSKRRKRDLDGAGDEDRIGNIPMTKIVCINLLD